MKSIYFMEIDRFFENIYIEKNSLNQSIGCSPSKRCSTLCLRWMIWGHFQKTSNHSHILRPWTCLQMRSLFSSTKYGWRLWRCLIWCGITLPNAAMICTGQCTNHILRWKALSLLWSLLCSENATLEIIEESKVTVMYPKSVQLVRSYAFPTSCKKENVTGFLCLFLRLVLKS